MTFQSETQRDEFIEMNLGIAQKVVYYLRRNQGCYPHTYEDLLQIAYGLLTEAADRYHPDMSTFSTYAWNYIRNGIIDVVRKSNTYNARFTTFIEAEDIDNITSDDEICHNYSDDISTTKLHQCLGELSEQDRYILEQYSLHDKTFRDIASELNIHFTTVKRRYDKICLELRNKLAN